jgi:hypothetical protein
MGFRRSGRRPEHELVVRPHVNSRSGTHSTKRTLVAAGWPCPCPCQCRRTYRNCQNFCPISGSETVTPDSDPGSRFWIPAAAPDLCPELAGMTRGEARRRASRCLRLVFPIGYYFWQLLYILVSLLESELAEEPKDNRCTRLKE